MELSKARAIVADHPNVGVTGCRNRFGVIVSAMITWLFGRPPVRLVRSANWWR
jgi:hypothetical protein